MTSIAEVSTHWPSPVFLAERQRDLGLTDAELRRYIRGFGLSRICWDEDVTEKELLLSALEKLPSLRGAEDRVRFLIRARTLRAPSPYPHSALQEIRREAGLRHARTFALTEHACASGLLAVEVAGMLLAEEGDPEALALILTGEKAPTRETQFVPGVGPTGEATAAVLVAASGTRDRVRGFATRTVSTGHPKMVMTPEAARAFRGMYADVLTEVIGEAVDAAGLTTDDIDLVLPHNVNRVAWTRLADRLGTRTERVLLDNVPRTGHCFGADPFVNYVTACELGRLRPGDHYLMVAVGLGACFAAMVVEH
ncbi:3-oxoacyl-[acyl-carrier-protein] synthase III C-terminal domain-containing protein [Streptomyces sp. NPDC059649]|uniref:3-oxoacyl-[acyl-carrier-protein] synthase III C-terminal domain-containing protein n=1 Tax=Streptomyces sp. NPDC059649 TaxID=3346895 RepID=UPI0036B0503F